MKLYMFRRQSFSLLLIMIGCGSKDPLILDNIVHDDLNKKQTEGGAEVNRADFIRELNAATQSLGIQQTVQQRRMDIEVQRLERERDRKLKGIQRNLNIEIRKVQNLYKLLAVAIPPIPPLILGLTVFLRRRSLEQESVTDARRR